MTQDYLPNRYFKYLFFAVAAMLVSVSSFAQRRGGGWGQGSHGNSTPRENHSQPRPAEHHQQAPVVSNHSNGGWQHQPRQMERRNPGTGAGNPSSNRWQNNRHDRPAQVNREPRTNNNNNGRWNRPGNGGYSNNNRYNNNRVPRVSHYDNFRRGWGGRPVYNRYNPGWRYSYLPRRNSIITSFAFPFVTINFGGYGYRYCDGVYYRPYDNAYRVVAPPLGIYINTLPLGYSRIYVGDYPYYYYNGTYYDDYNDSYRVVAPPVGAVVESIPEGYETITVDGETYYKVDGVQYKPVVQDNGEIWYEVIKVD